jgi:hypothetical protein
MKTLGYPQSWAEEIRTRLAAEGKAVEWRKTINGEDR